MVVLDYLCKTKENVFVLHVVFENPFLYTNDKYRYLRFHRGDGVNTTTLVLKIFF